MQTKKIILDIKKELKELDMLLDGMAQYPSVPEPLVNLTERKLLEVMENLAALKEPKEVTTTPEPEMPTITPEVEIPEEPQPKAEEKQEPVAKEPAPEITQPEVEEIKTPTTEVEIPQPEIKEESSQEETVSEKETEEQPAVIDQDSTLEAVQEEEIEEIPQSEEKVEVINETPQKEEVIETPKQEKTVTEEKKEQPVVPVNEETVKPNEKVAEVPTDEMSLDNEPIAQTAEPVNDEKKSEETAKVVSSSNKTPQKTNNKTVAESLQGGQSRNDALSSQSFPSLSSQMAQSPISDIKKAINLNDRFRFQRELFSNDSTLFNNTLEALNALNNVEEAQTFINDQFAWDFEEEIAQEFIQLVQRRFI